MTERTEITLEELADLPEGTRLLIDTRDEISMSYGTIPGAKHIPDLLEQAERGTLPKDRSLFSGPNAGSGIYVGLGGDRFMDESGATRHGRIYIGGRWISTPMPLPAYLVQDSDQLAENAIRRVRRFHEKLMTPFTKAIREYQLLQPGDRVAVCISGGKDSMLMAKLFQELQRHRKFPFELKFLVMDPGYNELNRLMIETNAAALGIPITIFETNIFDIVDGIPNSPCYLCARMRRGHLYRQAKELGCNKIALGHHYDDVIETILMGMLWSGQFQTMMPKVHSQNFEGMELIRPMSLIREEDIKAWRDYHGLHFIQCACHFTDTCSSCRDDGAPVSKRMETKMLIRKLHETNPDVEANLYNTARSVNLDKILGYKQGGEEHSFLDNY